MVEIVTTNYIRVYGLMEVFPDAIDVLLSICLISVVAMPIPHNSISNIGRRLLNSSGDILTNVLINSGFILSIWEYVIKHSYSNSLASSLSTIVFSS